MSKFLDHQTNNFAEYEAVILAFEALLKLVPSAERETTEVLVKLDSELIVKQMNGLYQGTAPYFARTEGASRTGRRGFLRRLFHPRPARRKLRRRRALANAAMDRGA